MLDLSQWIAQSPTYGNVILASRCHDVASVGIARLLVDLTIPLEQVKGVMDKLDPTLYGPSRCVEILNAEAGGRLFNMSGVAPSEVPSQLEQAWGLGRFLLRKKRQKPSEPSIGTSTLDLAIAEKNAEIFLHKEPDASAAAATVEGRWNINRHDLLASGLEPRNVALVKALFDFREKVGGFPVDLPFPGNPKITLIGKDAFEYVWRKHWSIDSPDSERRIYSRAWLAYEKVLEGTFLDEEARRALRMTSGDQ